MDFRLFTFDLLINPRKMTSVWRCKYCVIYWSKSLDLLYCSSRENIKYLLFFLELHPYDILCTLISRSRLYKYDDVVERVAQQLGLDDPSIIRLTPHNCYSQQPKPQPVKYRGVEHLSEMLVHYNQVIIDLMHNLSFCFLFKIKTSYFPSCMSDFGHIVL